MEMCLVHQVANGRLHVRNKF